jgi:hypothetical protein
LSERAVYDSEARDYAFLQTDVSPYRLWVKASSATADWAGPTYIGGATALGDLGHATDTITELFDLGHAA